MTQPTVSINPDHLPLVTVPCTYTEPEQVEPGHYVRSTVTAGIVDTVVTHPMFDEFVLTNGRTMISHEMLEGRHWVGVNLGDVWEAKRFTPMRARFLRVKVERRMQADPVDVVCRLRPTEPFPHLYGLRSDGSLFRINGMTVEEGRLIKPL